MHLHNIATGEVEIVARSFGPAVGADECGAPRRLIAELGEVVGAEGGQFAKFPVAPDVLNGIEFRV